MAAMGEGLRRVLGDRILRDLAGSTALFNLGSGMVLAVVVLFATSEVGVGAEGFGLIYGLGNVGFIFGALAVGRTVGPPRRRTDAPLGELPRGPGDGPPRRRRRRGGVALLLAGRFVGAVSAPLFNVTVVSLRQARVSPSLLGRVNATFEFIDWGTLPIGSLLGGLIGAALGPRAALEVAAACGVLSALWIQFSPASRLTTLVAHIDAGPRPAVRRATDLRLRRPRGSRPVRRATARRLIPALAARSTRRERDGHEMGADHPRPVAEPVATIAGEGRS